MVVGHRDVVAARALGCQDGFVGATQQIGAVVTTRHAGRHADAHGPGDRLAADRQAIAHRRADPVGEDSAACAGIG